MLEEIMGQIMGLVWSWILTAMLRPIAAIGQTARAALAPRGGGYGPGEIGVVRRRAVRGVLVLLVLWAGAYFLLQLGGLLFIGGITLLVAILGWFNRFFVVEVE